MKVAVSQGVVELESRSGHALVAAGEEAEAGDDAPRVERAPRVSSLCEWMRALYAKGTCKETAAGRLFAIDPQGQEIRLSVRDVHVAVVIEDRIARTTIDTTYFNDTSDRLEGTFQFLVPSGASVTRLAMYVNGHLMEGGVLEREEARQVYEQIRYERRRDPALLEWMEGNVYKMRIFLLEARQEKRIIVSYTQELEPLYGKLRYTLPLEAQSRAIYDHLGIEVRLRGVKEIAESSYGFDSSEDGEDLVLRRDEKPSHPEKDLVLAFKDARVPRVAALSTEDARYVLARWSPELPVRPAKHEARHFAILVDESGARPPSEVIAQNELVARLLSELDDQDRFVLLGLSTRVRRFRDGFEPCREAPEAALAWLDEQRQLGAQNLELGLAEAARALEGCSNPHVVYVGSGIAMLGEKDPEKLVERLAPGATFVGVGVGKKVDESLLASLASRTAGVSVLVSPEEPIAWRVFDLVAALATPRLSGLSAIALDERGSVVPGEVFLSRGTVSDGEEIRALARFAADARPARIVVSGFQGDGIVSKTLPLRGAREGALYLPPLWARRHVEALIRDGAERHRDEIVALGKKFFLATPFTSLIVLESPAMYAQFKVVPAPRDPWAFYETPETIPVVTDWGWGMPVTVGSEEELLRTVVYRGVPVVQSIPFTATTGFSQTSFAGIAAPPTPPATNILYPPVFDEPAFKPAESFVAGEDADLRSEKSDAALRARYRLQEMSKLPPAPPYVFGAIPFAGEAATDQHVGYNFTDRSGDFNQRGRIANILHPRARAGYGGDASPTGLFVNGDVAPYSDWYGWYPAYERDFLSPAPGLGLRATDMASLVERELGRHPTPAKQDARALALLARARSRFAERGVTFRGMEGFVAGDGRLCLRHRLESGLEELLFVNTDSVFELYPELGLAAVRPRTRFEEARLAELLPFLVPTSVALEGFTVTLEGERRVALVSGETRIELDFAEDGSLEEKRLYESGELERRIQTATLPLALSEPTEAGSFEPNLAGYVLLDMPVRTPAFLEAKLAKANGAEKLHLADQLLLSKILSGVPVEATRDERLGVLVLRFVGWSLTPVEMEDLAKRYPAFMGYAQAASQPKDEDCIEAAEKLTKTLKVGFFAGMSRYLLAQTLLRESASHPETSVREHAFDAARSAAAFAPAPELVLSLARQARAVYPNTFRLAELYDRVSASSDLAVSARLEAAQLLRQAGFKEEAARRFEAAYRLALEQGWFPPLEPELAAAIGEPAYTRFLEDALAWAQERPRALLAIAGSTRDLGLASRALLALPEPLPRARRAELARVVADLSWAPPTRGEKLVRALLERPSLREVPLLHDAAAQFALREGRVAVAARDLETALAIAARSGILDLSVFRQRTNQLFELDQQIAGATLPEQNARPLVERILKAIEQARSVDRESGAFYTAAARALLACGEKGLAFEAATTPIALHPREGAPFQEAAGVFSAEGEHALAAGLYAEAARLEPQDPTPLWQEASERLSLGERTEALALCEKIVKKTWHERFSTVVESARREIGR